MKYKSILLIDDDVDDQEIFLTALGNITKSVQCIAYTNAKEALNQLSQKQITTDVIFLDLNMPVMNGQQFLLEIKKDPALRDVPVVIFSTSAHAATISLTKELGAMEFITKPQKFDELVTILQSFLGLN